jgi:hypothetical protein
MFHGERLKKNEQIFLRYENICKGAKSGQVLGVLSLFFSAQN